MKCSDISKALNDDRSDLTAVRRHLQRCPECSRRFERILEIEEALRQLGLGVPSVDITAEVRRSLSSLKKRRSGYNRVRKWVWATSSVVILALLIITMPILAGWMTGAYRLAGRLDVGRSIESAMSYAVSPAGTSIQWIHLMLVMGVVLASVAAYLWRVSKRSIECAPWREPGT
jgi:predicted anti-sigma-YlaC factor YlaD